MMNAIALYFRYLRCSISGQLQYRTSFVLQTISHLLVTGIEFLGLWALFSRFGSLSGWTLPEVALFYGTIQMAFALADALGRGFDLFASQVKSGAFDRLLLRPRSTVLQLFGFEFTLRRIGRFSQGLAVTIYAALRLHPVLEAGWLLVVLSVLGSVFLFLGLYIIQATISFWTVETLEIMNTMTYGGVESAQYPMSIYRRWFRSFFTFFVPLACVTYLPLSLLVGRSQVPEIVSWMAPGTGVLFFVAALGLWRIGVRHYTSTGS